MAVNPSAAALRVGLVVGLAVPPPTVTLGVFDQSVEPTACTM